MATHSSSLARKIPWTKEHCGLQSTGSQRVGHDWATSLSFFHFLYPSPIVFSAPDPLADHCRPKPPPGDSWTLTGKSSSISSGVTAPFSWVLVHTSFIFVPSKSLFPQSCGRSVIKFHWPPKSNSLEFSIPLLDPQIWKPVVCPRTSLIAQELLSHKCSPDCVISCWFYGGANDTQSQVWLSLCGVSGFWCAQGFVWALQGSLVGMGFESKCNFSFLQSCWGFSFALRYWISFWCDSTFCCWCFFSSQLQFWSSCRRRWAHVLLLGYLREL